MGARKVLLVAIAAATALASPGRAALLTLSGSTLTIAPFLSTPMIQRPVLAQDPASIPVFVVSSGGFDEPASVFGPATVLHTAMFTAVPLLIQGIGVSVVNRTKTITCAGGSCGGPGPLDGRLFINVLALFNLAVPLDPVGSPGAVSQAAAGTLLVTIFGNDWTTGSQVITGITTDPFGIAVNTVTFVGSDARTPGHRGTLRLVSAFKVITNAVGNLPGVAIQTLTFTGTLPEPGALLLLASGAVALGLHARRRRRR